jgi:hypothetical protein
MPDIPIDVASEVAVESAAVAEVSLASESSALAAAVATEEIPFILAATSSMYLLFYSI